MFRFATPWLLVVGLVIPLMVWHYFRRRPKSEPALRYSHLNFFGGIKPAWRVRLRWLPTMLRLIVIACLTVALARPQKGQSGQEVETEGIDILLALDVSTSMRAEDFKPQNRLYVAKQTIKEFIAGRKNDRVGLIIFARQSYTQCPLTLDYGVLLNFLEQIDFGQIEDGTAIGLAIANCVNRLKDSPAKSKVIVLLTDGVNNAGEIEPVTAAGLAQALQIRIYTIGIGKPGAALYPVADPVFGKRYVYLPNEIDETMLKKIADLTGGLYYRAKTEKMLSRIYQQIGQLEKTKFKVKEYKHYAELFWPLTGFGLLVLLLEIFLGATIFRKLP